MFLKGFSHRQIRIAKFILVPMLIFLLICLLLYPKIVPCQNEQKAELETLRFVHIIWRHGDRSPSRTIPTDSENSLQKWEKRFGGLGQLTVKGAQQHFRLGKLLRARYGHFLSGHFDPVEFTYRTSDFNRTRMSALANLQGMFAPSNQEWPQLPLEEHTPNGLNFSFLPKGQDPIVFDEVDCAAGSWEEKAIFNSSEFKKAELANASFLDWLGEVSGIPHLQLRFIYYVHDPLTSIFLHQEDGFPLPVWANATVRNEIFRLYNLKNSFDFKSDAIKRLWAGPLFTEILQRMNSLANGSSIGSGQKFHAYSGHDMTIAGILAILGIFPEVFPTFANAVIIELHQNRSIESERNVPTMATPQNQQQQPSVRLFHKNESDGNSLWEYQIPGCGTPCMLKQLEMTRQRFLIGSDQWKTECDTIGR